LNEPGGKTTTETAAGGEPSTVLAKIEASGDEMTVMIFETTLAPEEPWISELM
jgi:hypothetical protein